MTLSGRDTPPSIQDGPYGNEPDEISNFAEISSDVGEDDLTPAMGSKLALRCYETSTQWINASRRQAWSNSLRAFQSVHPLGSKYLSRDYAYRSDLYRPKTRAMVRKGEAQTATAFFSNEEVVSILPIDDDDPMQKASADFYQALIQYRLTKGGIKWFLTVVGARQDCDVMGVCIAKAYWKYEEAVSHHEDDLDVHPDTGMTTPKKVPKLKRVQDQPHIDLIATENFRFDPASDWRDPIGTSPYLIELIPMYMQDVEAMIDAGEWHDVASSALRSATNLGNDMTRRARNNNRVPDKDTDTGRPSQYDIVWVAENIMRWKGSDWHFYSLGGTGTLLSDPRPIGEVYLHGCRPYVVGFTVPESHKSYPSSKVELTANLQRAANDDWNLRYDNLKLALNPRQILRQGSGIEINDARTFMPGKILITKDPKEDIVWDRPPDVTQSAYAEQDRINLDFDELVGDFSNSSVQANQLQEQSATGMHLMSGIAAGMVEYELRVFGETFVEPLIKLLIKLEQAYETDPVVLALAGKNAQLIQKYGINEITDELLNQELTLKVNVGIGATNPQMKLKNFMQGADILSKFYGELLLGGTKFDEVCKEVFGMLGYKDGSRFFVPGFNPQQAQQQLANAKGAKGHGGAAPPDPHAEMQMQQAELQGKMQLERMQQQGKMAEIQANAQNDQSLAHMDTQRTMLQEQMENQRTQYTSQQNAQQQRDQQMMQHIANMRNKVMDQQHEVTQAAMNPVERKDNNPIAQTGLPK